MGRLHRWSVVVGRWSAPRSCVVSAWLLLPGFVGVECGLEQAARVRLDCSILLQLVQCNTGSSGEPISAPALGVLVPAPVDGQPEAEAARFAEPTAGGGGDLQDLDVAVVANPLVELALCGL